MFRAPGSERTWSVVSGPWSEKTGIRGPGCERTWSVVGGPWSEKTGHRDPGSGLRKDVVRGQWTVVRKDRDPGSGLRKDVVRGQWTVVRKDRDPGCGLRSGVVSARRPAETVGRGSWGRGSWVVGRKDRRQGSGGQRSGGGRTFVAYLPSSVAPLPEILHSLRSAPHFFCSSAPLLPASSVGLALPLPFSLSRLSFCPAPLLCSSALRPRGSSTDEHLRARCSPGACI